MYCIRLLVHFLASQTPKIITQKLCYLQNCLANSLSVLLASSYIYNDPISIVLYFTMRLMAYWQDSSWQLMSFPSGSYLVSFFDSAFFFPVFNLVFPT